MDYTTFRLTLIERRRELNLSQRDLATRMGISQAYLCELETGSHCNPSLRTLDSWAEALDGAVTIRMTPVAHASVE